MSGYSTRSSGDALADRRYAYADAAFAEGDYAAARDLFEQALELTPDWPPAHFMLARACLELRDAEGARRALARARALDPEDRLGAAVLLARLDGAGTGAMPDAYVAALFDEYAPRFDTHLVASLEYRAPQLLAAMILAERETPFRHMIDLGCGTGLMARAMVGRITRASGVDLSARMLAIARESGLYASLACSELLAFLEGVASADADLVAAADVFCYVPDIAPVFAQVFRVLETGGLFAFTIQTHEGTGVIMGADSRVHHAPALVRDLAASVGFCLLREDAASTRKDRGMDVPGALFVLAKP
ncbi:MAG: methyltransferase domain-containing protein [Proteobacteria bacterium]|nr:methyltransferase domain-containing protein [Pseudomonadota bacterium]